MAEETAVTDERGRSLRVGHRVLVMERPSSLGGDALLSPFRGVVADVKPNAVVIFNFESAGRHVIRPQHIRVQYGRINTQDRFDTAMADRAWTKKNGDRVIIPGPSHRPGDRKLPASEGPSELERALSAMRRMYGSGMALTKDHRAILQAVLDIRKGQEVTGYVGLSEGWVSCLTKSERMLRMIDELIESDLLERQEGVTGIRVRPTDLLDETHSDPIAAYAATNLTNEREDEMATAKKAKQTKTKTEKAPRVSRPKVDFSQIKPTDFFRENAKGKSVFKPGHDARYAGILKRVASGNANADEKRLAFAKTLTDHEKVANSAHFQHLLDAARKAA